jgi:hypothetical protein
MAQLPVARRGLPAPRCAAGSHEGHGLTSTAGCRSERTEDSPYTQMISSSSRRVSAAWGVRPRRFFLLIAKAKQKKNASLLPQAEWMLPNEPPISSRPISKPYYVA